MFIFIMQVQKMDYLYWLQHFTFKYVPMLIFVVLKIHPLKKIQEKFMINGASIVKTVENVMV